MFCFDTQKLSAGPKRTNPDSRRWKCLLTKVLPKTLANKFVATSSAAVSSLRMNLPGSMSSADILCNFSKVISVVKPFVELLGVFKPMLVQPVWVLFCSYLTTLSCLSSLCLIRALLGSASLSFVCERHTSFTTLSLSGVQDSTWFIKIQPLCPLSP